MYLLLQWITAQTASWCLEMLFVLDKWEKNLMENSKKELGIVHSCTIYNIKMLHKQRDCLDGIHITCC